MLAANALPIEVVGFSADDRYVAWIEHGTAEDSGVPWARLHLTEVARNSEVRGRRGEILGVFREPACALHEPTPGR